jgi:hypothetical protein
MDRQMFILALLAALAFAGLAGPMAHAGVPLAPRSVAQPAPTATPAPTAQPAGQPSAEQWRRWRGPILLLVLMIAVNAVALGLAFGLRRRILDAAGPAPDQDE